MCESLNHGPGRIGLQPVSSSSKPFFVTSRTVPSVLPYFLPPFFFFVPFPNSGVFPNLGTRIPFYSSQASFPPFPSLTSPWPSSHSLAFIIISLRKARDKLKVTSRYPFQKSVVMPTKTGPFLVFQSWTPFSKFPTVPQLQCCLRGKEVPRGNFNLNLLLPYHKDISLTLSLSESTTKLSCPQTIRRSLILGQIQRHLIPMTTCPLGSCSETSLLGTRDLIIKRKRARPSRRWMRHLGMDKASRQNKNTSLPYNTDIRPGRDAFIQGSHHEVWSSLVFPV